jgi:uncharacterized delta-60 repeat protein
MRKLTVLLLLLLNCLASEGQNKGLDPTFGNGGIARTDIYTNKKFKLPTGLIIQPDGKILISGNFIARYQTDGTPDSSFAVNGFFTPPYSWFSNAIALLPDGKILSIGQPDSGCSYIVRLLPDGTVDSSFGRYGISKNNHLNPWNILVQPDGKIIIMGNGCGSFRDPEDSVIVGRFFADGSVDTAFGKQGFTRAYLGIYGGSITNMGLLPDGRIAMGGVGYDDSGHRAIIVLRFLPDGKLDTTLGGTGRIFPFYAWYCGAFTALADGKMLLTIADLNNHASLRLTADGNLDTSFGKAGFLDISLTLGRFVPLPNGRILCVTGMNGDAGIARLQKDGKGLDSSFGQNGIILTDLTGYTEDYFAQIALQADNKIVALGSGMWNKTTSAGVQLVRYNADAATGIQPHTNSRIALSVYPNPAQTYIRISGVSLTQLASVRITAADGRLVKYMDAPKSLTVPISGYAPGVYLLSVVLKNGEAASSRFTITE